MKGSLAVVILNYNGLKFLKKFLPGVIAHSKADADIVIIDNASNDGSLEYIHHNHTEVKTITLDKNYGYAKGYNLGLEQLNHTYFILLNSDVEVTEGWIKPLLALIKKYPKTAAVQPKILDYNRKTHFEYAGAAGGFIDLYGYPFCRGRIFDSLEEDLGQYNKSTEIFWASGACMLVNAELFKHSGGFDARFFAHMEEIDLCWRFHNQGYTVLYEPKSVVYHVGAGTLSVNNLKKTYLNYRNNLAMLFKNLPTVHLFPIIFSRLVLDGISGVRYLLKGEFKNLWAIIKAHFAFYGWIPYLLKNRSKNFIGFNKLYNGSIVFQYFIKKKKTFTEICSE